MATTGGSAIRGSRVGAGPMGEEDKGYKAERIERIFYCALGHNHTLYYAANLTAEEIPTETDCQSCGLPAGTDKKHPPQTAKHEPYKTHLAYVKERRTDAEAKQLLDEAVALVRSKRQAAIQAAAAAERAEKAAAKKKK
ncbi:MAG: hypothetical protein RLZZ164_540 [Actinomycetota bacterium]